jgi:hypothetical protein
MKELGLDGLAEVSRAEDGYEERAVVIAGALRGPRDDVDRVWGLDPDDRIDLG